MIGIAPDPIFVDGIRASADWVKRSITLAFGAREQNHHHRNDHGKYYRVQEVLRVIYIYIKVRANWIRMM